MNSHNMIIGIGTLGNLTCIDLFSNTDMIRLDRLRITPHEGQNAPLASCRQKLFRSGDSSCST